MHEDGPKVALLLSEQEAECLLGLLLTTDSSDQTDQLLCRVAEVQRLLNRSKVESMASRPGPPCCTSRAA